MNTRIQIFLDKYVSRILVLILNIFVRILGKILSIDHSLDHDFKRIVVCKYKGMGSILQATPLLQTLKENYPGAQITFVSSSSNKHILKELDKAIDHTIILNDSSAMKFITSLPSFILKTIKLRAEVWIDLEIYAHTSSLLTTLSMSKNRLGYYLRSSQYRMGIFTHMMFYNTNAPISETYLQMARLLGCKKIISTLYPLKSNSDISKFNLSNSYFVINPNASDLRIERRWPKEKYTALINELTNIYADKEFVLIGSPGEANYTKEIFDGSNQNKNITNLAGKTTISELIQVIDSAELMITNDSGPMHIAFCTKTKALTLFGPCNPSQYGIHANGYAIYKPVYCSPCVHEFQQAPCNGNNVCMQSIQTAEVLKKISSLQNQEFIQPKMSLPLINQIGPNTLGKIIRG